MRYTTEDAVRRLHINIDANGSIHRTGSVTGMQKLYGWEKGGQVRIGSYIYNIGKDAVDRLRRAGLLKGE